MVGPVHAGHPSVRRPQQPLNLPVELDREALAQALTRDMDSGQLDPEWGLRLAASAQKLVQACRHASS